MYTSLKVKLGKNMEPLGYNTDQNHTVLLAVKLASLE